MENLETGDKVIIRPFESQSDIDFVISGQLELYKTEFGFGTPAWVAYVTDGVNELVRKFNPDKDCLLILEKGGAPAGSIAITHDDGETAKLRFFFIKPEARGFGAGRRLVETAVGFCRKSGYTRVYLWTFDQLDAARHLYGSAGFRITETQRNDAWGDTVLLEERWVLEL
jgi:GNAT superfamily N-acetyltransferase